MKGLTHEESRKLREDIVEYRKAGHYIRECCERFGVNREYVKLACRGVKHPWIYDTEAMSNAAREQARHRKPNEQTAINMINRKAPSFEYVGGYTGYDGSAALQCKRCGHIFTRNFWSIKQGTITCPECKAKELKQKRIEKDKLREAQKEQLQMERMLRKKYTQIRMKQCPVCNAMFIGGRTYCSDICRNQNKQMLKDGYRSLFPLEEVFQRENGICWICGGLCDWDDYEDRNGVRIYGNTYPSRDHVVPKSKGGVNSWENIRLAHRICNSLKGSKMA